MLGAAAATLCRYLTIAKKNNAKSTRDQWAKIKIRRKNVKCANESSAGVNLLTTPRSLIFQQQSLSQYIYRLACKVSTFAK